ncbi:MAG: APC family permease [Elusimicrobia bacterium]|nr:APC family permease [Elusimicrobiota bacterium]
MIQWFKNWIFGRPKSPLDPRVFHNVSLVAFFAWVGLGADGLSSSCYGPEEAFRALGQYTHLAIPLALAVAATVFILSASYSEIIEAFPTGGGGYLVAAKLIGPLPGLVSGSALLVDYILTVAISVASSIDAIFSFLPPDWAQHKFIAAAVVLAILVTLNLRGVKESIIILTPIFLVFLVTHAIVILYGIFGHWTDLPGMVMETVTETREGLGAIGFIGMGAIFLRAFALGGGTFTGIEAVSNGLQILREPRAATGKRTMKYMAWSLALTAGGILINYVLNGVHHVPGKTMNAALVGGLTSGWPFGKTFLFITLLSEGALLGGGPGRVPRRPPHHVQHGHRLLVAPPVHQPIGPVGDQGRRFGDRCVGPGGPALHRGFGPATRGDVLHQCVFDLFADSVRHGQALSSPAPHGWPDKLNDQPDGPRS